MSIETLTEYVGLVLEARMREADVSNGSRVPWGSQEHIEDLETRISDLTKWRDKQRKGSEARANYARTINMLKAELKSAKRKFEKQNSTES